MVTQGACRNTAKRLQDLGSRAGVWILPKPKSMLHRSKIFIGPDLRIAISSIGAVSNPALQIGKYIVVVFLPDRPLPSLHYENDRDVSLGVGFSYDMPLRWS